MSFPNTVRQQPHRVEPHLGVFVPPVVIAAQVNSPSIAKGALTIPYNNVTQGSYLAVEYDMTMYVGSTPGGKDLGRVRVRSATSSQFTIAENDHIKWSDDVYVTVVRFWEVWGVYPFIDMDNGSPVFYKDRDIAYTNQNVQMDPIMHAGAHRALFEHESVNWSSSGSFSPVGASLTGYNWHFQGGVPTGSTSAHPNNINYPEAGFFTTKLTGTDSNGKSYSTYRHVMVFDTPTGNIKNWGFESPPAGDRGSGGYTIKLWVREPANIDDFVDGALVVIFEDQWFGSTKRRGTKFVGYISDESISYNAVTSKLTFTAKSVTGIAASRDTFSAALDSTANPGNWTQMHDITVDKAAAHFLRWHSTMLRVCDFHITGDGRLIQFADYPRGPVYNVLRDLYSSAILANVVADRQGLVYAEIDLNYMDTGTPRNVAVSMDFDRIDWMNEPSIVRVQQPSVSYVELGGVYYSGDGTHSYGAWLSGAPGDIPAYFGSPHSPVTGLAIDSQDDLNVLSGLFYADVASEFPEVNVEFAGNYDLDIAPQKWARMSIAAQDTWRRLVWNRKRLIPQAISWMYDQAKRWANPSVKFKTETWGLPGDTIEIPATPPYDPPDFDFWRLPPAQPLPEPEFNQGDGNLVYVCTSTRVGRTRNFLSSTPNWTSVWSGSNAVDFIVDPYDPANTAYVVTISDIIKTTNLNATTPTWSTVLTSSTAATALGSTNGVDFKRGRATITSQGLLYFSCYCHNTASGSDQKGAVFKTTTGGSSWTYYGQQMSLAVDSSFNNISLRALEVSQHNGDIVWVGSTDGSFDGKIYKSTNGASSFSIWRDTGLQIVEDIHVPYEGNDSDNIVFVRATDNNATSKSLQRTINDGGGWTDITPTNFATIQGSVANGGHRLAIHTYTQNNLTVFASNGQEVFYSPDGGDSFTQSVDLFSFSSFNYQGFGGFPFNEDMIEAVACNTSGVDTSHLIVATLDLGASWEDKTGDWISAIGSMATTFVIGNNIVPIWVAT